jgi:adenylate cyclase
MVVHANIVNTIVSGAFVRRAPDWAEVAVILLAGAIVSILAATRPVLQAGPLAVGLAAVLTAFNAWIVFHLWSVWLVIIAPLGAVVASFLVVTAYRQLTEERAKKQIRSMFAHALSPALVDRLLVDPSLARLGGERRELSCFFSDLANFTPLSERLGERRTVRLLNHYFDHMTEVVQTRRGGYLNKFLADGLLVLFGAPVWQDDHAARAVRAAVDCIRELDRLNQELQAEHGERVNLSCRIGIATGEAMVGNCGSTERIDYTAIGDTVNLASRLETANKALGTHILVDETTWRQSGGDGILARPLGRILVVGKREPVGVWSIVGQAGDVSAEEEQSVAEFARGVDHFAERRFAEAAQCFETVLAASPDDKAASLYAGLCRLYVDVPPADDWAGAVQLTEK